MIHILARAGHHSGDFLMIPVHSLSSIPLFINIHMPLARIFFTYHLILFCNKLTLGAEPYWGKVNRTVSETDAPPEPDKDPNLKTHHKLTLYFMFIPFSIEILYPLTNPDIPLSIAIFSH